MGENEQVASEILETAATQGWVPKEEFRGDPEKWVDADKFVERGEKVIPILKERNDHLVKEIREMKSTFGEFVEFSRKSEERAYTRAMKELTERKEQAVLDSDVETFRQVEKEQLDLAKSRQEAPAKPSASDVPPDFKAFADRNEWYSTDPEMKAYADNMGNFIKAAKSHLTYPQILQEVEKEVKQRYPSKFENVRRENGNQQVEGVSETGIPRRAGGRSWNDLPAEAKGAYERMARGIKQKFSADFTKEEYVKNYEWD